MAAAAAAPSYEFNLDEYWQIILRRRWIIIFFACSLGLFSWLFTWLNQPPAIYSSTASVKVERSTDLTGLLLQSVTFSEANDMSTQLAMIQSFTLMERVAKRLGMIPKEMSSEELRTNPEQMDEILGLKNAISAEQEEESSIINITATSGNAEHARDLAQTVAEEFKKMNSEEKNRRVIDAKLFIEQQRIVVGDRLKKAEEAIRTYRQEHNLAMGEGTEAAAQAVSVREGAYRQAIGKMDGLMFTLKQLKKAVQQKAWNFQAISAPRGISVYFDSLNQRLVAMALEYTKVSANYKDAHPRLINMRVQARTVLRSMISEVEKQVKLTKRGIKENKEAILEAERRFKGSPKQAVDLQRLKRGVMMNEKLFAQLEEKYQEVLIKEAEKVEEVSMVRPALVSHRRINPVDAFQTAIAGSVLGLVLGLITSLIMEAMDTSVSTIEEMESFMESPVVGFIPQLSDEEAKVLFAEEPGLATSGDKLERQIRLISHFSPSSTIAEAYRSLRTNLMFSQGGGNQVIMVTSSTMKEGKSTTAANIAIAVAQQGSRVLLIDGDLRKPMQNKTFGLPTEPGLREYLLGQYPWQDITRRFSDIMLGEMGVDEALFTPGLDQLDILTSGHDAANASELLAAPAMETLIEEVRQEYDLVFIDSPPMLHTAEGAMMASKVDGVLLVYHIGAVVRGVLKRVKGSIEGVGGTMIGVVLNGVRGELSPDFSKYKMDSYYAYSYGSDKEEETAPGKLDQVRLLATERLTSLGQWVAELWHKRGEKSDA